MTEDEYDIAIERENLWMQYCSGALTPEGLMDALHKLDDDEETYEEMVGVPREPLKRLLEYIGKDEQAHYEAEPTKKHIWRDIVKLLKALEGGKE